MNRQVNAMIKLQKLWGIILQGKSNIEKSNQAIADGKAGNEERKELIVSIERDILNKKSTIKQKEIDLAGLDEQCSKLEDRKMVVKTEKELKAIGNELQKAMIEKGEVEDELINLFDELEAVESKLERSKEELLKDEEDLKNTIKEHTGRISRIEETIQKNQASFDEVFPELEPGVSARFKKLIESGNRIAIASVEDDICGNCRFIIPGFLALDSTKDDKIVTCTQCGRYIYKIG